MIRYSHHFDIKEINADDVERGFEAIRDEMDSGDVGYYALPLESQAIVENVKKLCGKIDKKYNTIAIIGIGGSSLGIKAIERLLRPKTPNAKKILYFENSDPISVNQEISRLDKRHTLFIVISKSGGTVETLSIFKRILATFDLEVERSDQIMVISDEGSILSKFADLNHLRRFVIPSNVGGRFSVLSAVGMVPLTLAGFDTLELLKGAQSFLERFLERREDHLLEKAVFYISHSDCLPINVLFAYSDTFEEFGKWMVQIWGESLGKRNIRGERVGLTPISLIGSVDQHSFLQLIVEGPLNKTVTFMRISESEGTVMIPDISLPFLEKSDFVNGYSFNELINAQCMATMKSVIESDVSVDEIEWVSVDEYSVGEMILYYELLTSTAGALLEINTYDQPGVEIGKKILQEYFN
jgi:glucose-6-phosphate isomerase